ncbi:MAG: Homoserine dehydrogenase [Clostridiales bacterium 38_11]|nr:MAG: Homoserine dehydrogenase [Clostridiales bacterium 38_11]
METVRIGILGMGTVASGLAHIMALNQDIIQYRTGKILEIEKVLVKNLNKNRDVDLDRTRFTINVLEIIDNQNVDIVVELIGGIHPAFEYVRDALKNKKHVVTANKALIATHGEELENIALENGVRLMYEASVGGGIPIINTMINNLPANDFTEISGIVNGTTNYILTQMTERNLEFDQAIKEAQEMGFAEADPSSDVEGDDAAFKIAILSYIAFGQRIGLNEVPKEGIAHISREDIKYADELGYVIKLIASSQKRENEIELRVHPTFISKKHPLATVKNEFNAVLLKGNAVGEVMLYGKGAGAMPTGSAVLGDIIAIAKEKFGENKQPIHPSSTKYKIVNKGYSQYYIRMDVVDKPGVLGYISNIFGKNNISLASVVQRYKHDLVAPLVFITHEVERKNIDDALQEVRTYSNVLKIASIITVEKSII